MPNLAHEEKKIEICYESHGNPANPSVILIAGITAQLTWWPSTITEGLAAAGFHVITFDNRDAGLSSQYDHLDTPSLTEALAILQRGEHFSPPYTLHDMTSDIVSLMDLLSIHQAHVVGISMGGVIAQIFAIDHPDRTLSLSCIATTSGDPDLPDPTPDVMNFFINPVKSDDIDDIINQHVQQYKLYHHPDDFNLEETIKERKQAYQRAHNPIGNTRQLQALMTTPPRGELLKLLSVPSLILHGDIDPVFPKEHGKRLADCLQNSRLHVFKKMGHGIPARIHTELINELIKHFNSSKKSTQVTKQ